MRLLAVIMLMTILSPLTTAIGWYICLKGAKVLIETAHAVNSEVSNDNVKFKIIEYQENELSEISKVKDNHEINKCKKNKAKKLKKNKKK